MNLIVQKYGGSSVSNSKRIRRVARKILKTKNKGYKVVVIVSAMGDTTNQLLKLAAKLSNQPPARELDMLMTAGERISIALLAISIHNFGVKAYSFTGSQAGMITDSFHGKAKIISVNPKEIKKVLDKNCIAIIAGFQGMSNDTRQITTLGRGGSDTTAVAIAAALNASCCEIYTDVDGIYTADPRLVSAAKKITKISSEEMLEMAASGAQVLHLRCVEYARKYNIPIHVRSSFKNNKGTWVLPKYKENHKKGKEIVLEKPIISGVIHDSSESKITIIGIPDIPGKAAEIFHIISKVNVNVDMIVQNLSDSKTRRTNISFTAPKSEAITAYNALKSTKNKIQFQSLKCDNNIGKLSLIGAGMRSNPGIAYKFFKALYKVGINVQLITTSEIRISIITHINYLEKAVQALHDAFRLNLKAKKII